MKQGSGEPVGWGGRRWVAAFACSLCERESRTHGHPCRVGERGAAWFGACEGVWGWGWGWETMWLSLLSLSLSVAGGTGSGAVLVVTGKPPCQVLPMQLYRRSLEPSWPVPMCWDLGGRGSSCPGQVATCSSTVGLLVSARLDGREQNCWESVLI